MNTVIISGRLTADARENGKERKALSFRIAAKYGYDTANDKERVEYVPCVLFTEPEDKLAAFLSSKGKGTYVEFRGRVSSSRYQSGKETKYRTDVVVDKSTFNIITK